MANDSFVIRSYCPDDLARYLRFHGDAEAICHSPDTFFLASLKDDVSEPTAFFHEDLLLAEERGEIVGSCRVVPESAIGRAVLRLFIARGLLSREIPETLVGSAINRVGALGLERAHADVKEDDEAARNLFAHLGFRPVRRYTEMVLDMNRAPIVQSKRKDCHPLEPGAEEEFTRLQNRVFGGSWGFCPNTTPEVLRQLNTPGYGYDGLIVAYRGNKPVGYCWTTELRRPNEKSKAASGRIHMMGVAPESRGRGIGTHILRVGLEHLAAAGARTVELTVDNENEPAVSLYAKVGFKPKTAIIWYEKKMK